MVLQLCYKDAKMVLHCFHSNATVVVQWCDGGVTVVLPALTAGPPPCIFSARTCACLCAWV
jgi:hypothetical protein